MSDRIHRDPQGLPSVAAHAPDTNRRRFLMFGASAAGAAAAVPVLAAPAALVEAPAAKPASQGYQETEHVRRLLRDDAPLNAMNPARRVFTLTTSALTEIFGRRRTMLLTRKTDSTRVAGPRLDRTLGARIATMDRRAFLKRSGLVAGAGAFASQLPYGTMGKAQAADETANVKTEVHRTVCTHCSVGCAIDAVVENGVWTRQEPVFDSPLNLGAHCAKGASIREHGHGEHRLKSPMKLVNGKYQKISWEQAINEVGDKLAGDPQGIGTRRRVLGRQLEAQQRAVVPAAQVRLVFRQQQLRPPGSHLPFDHRRRRREHVGLRRDDELVQRHAEHEVRDVHRQQRGRGASGVDAAHAAREGDRREDDRRRSALHAHGREGRRIRSHPLGHRHRVRVRHAVPHLQEQLAGRQVHQRSRLRHGQGQGRRHGEVDAGQGRGSDRRARGGAYTRSPR